MASIESQLRPYRIARATFVIVRANKGILLNFFSFLTTAFEWDIMRLGEGLSPQLLSL